MNTQMEKFIHDTLAQARAMREHMWTEHGEDTINTQLSVLLDGEEEFDTVPDSTMELFHDATKGDMQQMIRLLLRIPRTWDNWTKYRAVVLITDSHATHSREATIPTDWQRGELEKDYRTNPASEVTRACVVCLATDDLVGGVDVAMGLQPFSLSDGGVFSYEDPTIDGDAQGGIPDVLREAFDD